MQRVRKVGWEVLSSALGLVVSASVVPGVSLNVEGLIVATAIIAAPMVVLGITNDELAGTGESGSFMVFFSLTWVWIFLSVPAADYATPGFNIHGAWHTVETIFVVAFASMPLAFLHQRMIRSQRN